MQGKLKLGEMSSSDALKCLNWLPLAVRRLSHRCIAVEKAIKGNILQHFESFKSTLRPCLQAGRVTLLPEITLRLLRFSSVTLQVKHEQITKLENNLFPKQKYDKLRKNLMFSGS